MRFTTILLIFLASVAINIASAASQPNIVIILADDMGYGDAGCYNPDSKIPTPNIDRLAKEGMRFTDAHAPASVCIPSRYALMTGRYAWRRKSSLWGIKGPVIEEGRVTLASMLKTKGYTTACIGKWHLGVENWKKGTGLLKGGPVDRGFDSFFGIPASLDIPPYYYIRGDKAVAPPTGKVADSSSVKEGWTRIQGAFFRGGGMAPGFKHDDVLTELTDEAVKFVDANKEKPFFLYFPLTGPHTPWLPTPEMKGKSKASMYGDFVATVDHTVGRVLKKLDDLKLTEKTLVLFSSDNGPVWYPGDVKKYGHTSTGKYRGMKGDAFEGGHRMPYIVRWPGVVKPRSVCDQTVCLTDTMATLEEIVGANIKWEEAIDSTCILPLLKGTSNKPVHQYIIHRSSKQLYSIRVGDWKLVMGLGSGGFTKPARVKPEPDDPKGQLYHLGKDPGETQNLWKKEPNRVKHLEARLKDLTSQAAP